MIFFWILKMIALCMHDFRWEDLECSLMWALLPTKHDQLSSIHLFKHCRLFVAADVIYRVCHFLWLFIICLILFLKNNNKKKCCQESRHARWIYLSLIFQSRQGTGQHFMQPWSIYATSFPLFSLSYFAFLLPLSIQFHFIYILLPLLFFIHASVMYLSKAHKSIP